MKKLTLPIISILSILGIYNALVFTFCKNLTKNFWCGYIFITLSILIVLLSFVLTAFKANKNTPSGYSITTLSIYYFIFETILGSCLMFFNISFAIVLLPQLICFLLFLPFYALGLTKFGTEQTNIENKTDNKPNQN